MKAFCAMVIAGAVLGSAARACAEAQLINGVQAVVDESIVTLGEVQLMTFPAAQMLNRQFRTQPEVLYKKLTEAANESIDQLVQRQLILRDYRNMFSQPEQRTLVEKEINKEVDQDIEGEIRTRYGGNRMSLIQTLQAEGVTLERHRQQIRDRMIISWLRQKNISSELIVSPHRVEVYYLAHRDEFKVEEEVRLRMIVLKCPGESEVTKTEKLAEDILRKLKEGATFAEMATIYSEGSQRNQGGDLGWWEPSRLNKGLADTALSLQAGQHSGVMSRSAGEDYWVCQFENGAPILGRHYTGDTVLKKEIMAEERRFENAATTTNLPPPIEFYLMLVEDKRPARFKTLVEVRDQIEKDMLAQERNRLEKQWIDKLKKKTFVRVF
jgi:peptidyl-prolyl cis-trans isomerase SurA